MALSEKEAKIELIPVTLIKPLPMQFSVIDPDTFKMLLEDLRKNPDKVSPIFVRPLTPEEQEACKQKYPFAKYEIVDGHKRFECAKLLHWETIPAIVLNVSREEAIEINYRKNLERGTVDPMLEALYFKHLYLDLKMPAHKIAEQFSTSESNVRRILSRVGIQPEAARKIVKESMAGKQLTGKHLDVIAKAPPQAQVKLVDAVFEKGLSAKETQIVADAATKRPDLLEKALEVPKSKLVEEAKEIIKPPPEKLAYEEAMELRKYYPATMIGFTFQRYKGEYFADVLKAATWLMWNKLLEGEKEKIVEEAIKLGGRGFKEPISG